jgi:SNF2 family DNA or RNA helicase
MAAVQLVATLFPHQEVAVEWCLEREAAGCVLADDMGLGKTVTTCAVLARRPKRTLIVAPVALVHQWESEIARHVSGLRTLIYHGTKRREQVSKFADADVVITNVESVASDFKNCRLSIYAGFERLIVDEAHILRNAKSIVYAAIYQAFGCKTDVHKILLTGTPICNKPDDLISLVTLLNLEEHSDPEWWSGIHMQTRIDRLQAIRDDILLRRTKEEVIASQLPKKEILDVPITLESNKDVYGKEYGRLKKRIYKPVISKILRMRQCINQISLIHKDIANDPVAIQEYKDQLPSDISAKLEYIRSVVEAAPEGDKIVVFSQWTTMLDHIKVYIQDVAPCAMYTGKLKMEEKREVLSRFNEDPSVRVLLISLKSGGCGLNLCVANHAILTEPYFNVAEEQQAIDRIYRIGQKKNVFVHRLFVPSTIDTWMQHLKQCKVSITDAIIRAQLDEDIKALVDEKRRLFHELVQ